MTTSVIEASLVYLLDSRNYAFNGYYKKVFLYLLQKRTLYPWQLRVLGLNRLRLGNYLIGLLNPFYLARCRLRLQTNIPIIRLTSHVNARNAFLGCTNNQTSSAQNIHRISSAQFSIPAGETHTDKLSTLFCLSSLITFFATPSLVSAFFTRGFVTTNRQQEHERLSIYFIFN